MPKRLPDEENVKSLMSKYKKRLSKDLGVDEQALSNVKPVFSREYNEFKEEYLPSHMNWYEKACNFCGDLIEIPPSKNDQAEFAEAIRISHLNVTPNGINVFNILGPLAIILIGSFIGYMLPIVTGTEEGSLFLIGFSILLGAISFAGLRKLPRYFADSWRMKASNQMVLCIFYIVTFMRHTSNLELAIEFAAEHLGPPLALDLKKILWDVETQKYESVKESLDAYLESWKKYNMEFIEAFHLVESSLYEPSEGRRLEMLDKSLDVILSETYEKMLHYAHNLKSPITMIHMIGVILPILFMVILPLAINFMTDESGVSLVKWYYIAALYNFLLPVGVYLLGKSILSSRPTGYGSTDISEPGKNKKDKTVKVSFLGADLYIDPKVAALTVWLIFFAIGISPLVMYYAGVPDTGVDVTVSSDFSTPCEHQFCLLEYKTIEDAVTGEEKEYGPFGLGATLLSIAFTLSFSLSLGIYYSLRSKNVIEIREKTKKLEAEFASALFQLGNRLGDGLPAEIAFGRVAQVMEGTVSGNFFNVVSTNIRRLGMSVNDAIFNPRTGALVYFPSNVIESSMKVLLQSIQKGPEVAAQALVNVSRYIKEIHSVNERLKDLMADVIASMRSQINFLTPVISGIVVGITSMISNIMSRLASSQEKLQQTVGGQESMGGMASLLSGTGIPTYYFQIIVGLYVVQIIYILTILANGIENGEDKLAERYTLGKNMLKSVTLYCVIAFAIIIAFNLVASQIMRAVGGV